MITNTITENSPELWIAAFPFSRAEQHKYSRGHVVVNGGDMAHTGAARLAARAALRVGAGLVSIACTSAVLPVYAATNLAVMCKVADNLKAFSALIGDGHINSIVIGPGNGVGKDTRQRVLAVLATKKNAVLDADALTSFADHSHELFFALHENCVLTPHEGEFAKLFKIDSAKDKITRAKEAAKTSQSVVVLKGADTVIAAPDGQVVVNNNAPPTLATAGSGDVLAGMIAGLMAAGMPPFKAACAAAWLHGAAAQKFGIGLIAEDLPELLPQVMSQLRYSL